MLLFSNVEISTQKNLLTSSKANGHLLLTEVVKILFFSKR